MVLGALLAAALLSNRPETLHWTVHCDRPTVQVPSTLYGMFFEEINHAGDGGLYAELLQNPGFRDGRTIDPWMCSSPEACARGADGTLTLNVKPGETVELSNPGYWGIGAKKNQRFVLRIDGGGPNGAQCQASLKSSEGEQLASARIDLSAESPSRAERFAAGAFSSFKASSVLTADADDSKAALVLRFDKPGEYKLRGVSLMPADTWKGHPNGLRPDLANVLDAMHPSFVRFPGGCWVEGDTMATSYRWKNTIGPLDQRRPVQDLWGYMSDNGLGFHEYLQMCDDLGATPLFVINCGMSHHGAVPLDKMGDYVQDALDAIEYANGPASSKWGSVRAANGHPAPFGLKYIEVGNENGGPAYEARYALFYKAIKQAHPEINIVADVWGGIPHRSPVDMIDEHWYSNPEFFLKNADRYDKYDRKGPKIYVGEYAVTEGSGKGNLKAALAESAFMMGMERNSDVVRMASYAPLLANVSGKSWSPDLIYFDSTRVAPTPSYYVQKLFSNYRPSEVVASDLEGVAESSQPFEPGGIAVGTWGTQAEFKDLEVQRDGKTLFSSRDGHELSREGGKWQVQEGALAQLGPDEGVMASATGAGWDHYTFTLKAKKLGGREGFLVAVGRKNDGTFLWWNVGGWGNQQSAIERSQQGGRSVLGNQIEGTIETGRWYDLRIDYSPESIKCYIDGKLSLERSPERLKLTHAIAGKDKGGAIILKAVNASSAPEEVAIDLDGTQWIAGGEAVVLTSGSPTDENSLDNPNRVVPVRHSIPTVGTHFKWTLGPNSLTILRLLPAQDYQSRSRRQ